MKLIRSSLLVAAVACVLAGCSTNVRSGSDSNGGGGGIVEHNGTGAGAGMAGAGGSAAGTAGSSGGLTDGDSDSAGAGGEQDTLTLSSSAFAEMGPLGAQYQCGATGVSPPLSWTAGPEGTHSYAVVMVGPDGSDVGSLYHWVIWDIPAATTDLPEAVAQLAMPSVPAGSSQISPGTDGATWQG
ncbi:MAG: YbhB/YbcL family Raf kinase inhibitor-like protein [Pseudomonadota bacterium]